MPPPRALLALALLVTASAGCASVRDANFVEQDIRHSGTPSVQPLLDLFEERGVHHQSRRVTPPAGSAAQAVYSVSVRFDGRPNVLTAYVFASEQAAVDERRRYDFGRRERSRRRTPDFRGRPRETVVREPAPAFQEGALVVVVQERDGALEGALREAFSRQIR